MNKPDIQTFGFPTEYDSRFGTTLTGVVPFYHFERGQSHLDTSSMPPANSYLVEVIPTEGESWHGAFEKGVGGVSGLFATPSPTTLCVCAFGDGYLVPVLNPTDFRAVKCDPVKNVFSIPDRNILVFADFTVLEAYGPSGMLWETQRISFDGLKITQVTDERVYGLARDPASGCDVPFVVDVDTGKFEGGSYPN